MPIQKQAVNYEAIPIDPAEIISGEPEARAAELWKDPASGAVTGLFSCTRGCFNYRFEVEESMAILQGVLVLWSEAGETVELTAGDSVVIPAKTTVAFDVKEDLLDMYRSGSVG
jgi:uncharacterized protein